MNFWKFLIFALILVFAILLGFSLLGFIYGVIWYLFWVGVIALGGVIGYKLLFKNEALALEERDGVSEIELDNAKIIQQLEEYKEAVKR